MLLGDFTLEGSAARLRLPEHYVRSSTHPAKPEVPAIDLRNGVIKRLLCSTCNSTWAQRLETRAAQHLHSFLAEDAPLDPRVVVPWLAFLTVKVFAYHRSAWPGGEPFGDCLSHIARGEELWSDGVLFVTRGDGPSEDWLFQSCITGDMTQAGKRLYSSFALRGFAWVLRIADSGRIDAGVEARLTKAEPGRRAAEVATANRAALAALGLPYGRPFSATWLCDRS
jgi:hypothetical protein